MIVYCYTMYKIWLSNNKCVTQTDFHINGTMQLSTKIIFVFATKRRENNQHFKLLFFKLNIP